MVYIVRKKARIVLFNRPLLHYSLPSRTRGRRRIRRDGPCSLDLESFQTWFI